MEKQLKDYLHLYLGCDVQAGNGVKGKLVAIGLDYARIKGLKRFTRVCAPESVVPILRPLSSMTDSECLKFLFLRFDNSISHAFFHEGYVVFQVQNKNGGRWWNKNHSFHELNPEQIRYLLSKHFDLFGLIESGLAIDLTSLSGETK